MQVHTALFEMVLSVRRRQRIKARRRWRDDARTRVAGDTCTLASNLGASEQVMPRSEYLSN
jgi:hypothetical protein